MENLIWIGAIVSLVGVAGLVWCVLIALRAKRDGLEGAEFQAVMQKVTAINMGALCISAIGLIMVVVGILLR